MKTKSASAKAVFSISILIAQWTATQSAFAWPPQVAPELEFTNDEIYQAWREQPNDADTSNPTALSSQQRFRDEVARICGAGCRIVEMTDKYDVRKYRVNMPDAWYFDITLDPGIIEVTAKPIDLPDMSVAKRGHVMQSMIWDVARNMGLRVDTAGHLNFGVESTFGGDALLFRNFIVDYLNHIGMVEGALGYIDTANAPHPERLAVKQRDALKKIFAEFDPKRDSIKDLSSRIYEHVYFKSTVFGGADGEPPQKYHSLNITSIVKDGDPWPRLELRTIPMQGSAEELELLSKLFAARIEKLRKESKPVEYTADVRFKKKNYAGKKSELVEDFYNYVTESGLPWKDYERFVKRAEGFEPAIAEFYAKKEAEKQTKLGRLGDALSGLCQ